ncbi:hypothetical protein SAMN05660359_02148 [Geodermatophilus obscurus]|uniref:Uncharacterized protein n=1 Tax=Geodermatophilus obscurus TaxID=1861 RepID=A0A1I5FJM6_9ACTN|nr:hypothetical protein [Geodermatophilus obscurus]SFO23902.1 hypothetical protein SAMN05660359_02148 [Geodermatophilus obscurus]
MTVGATAGVTVVAPGNRPAVDGTDVDGIDVDGLAVAAPAGGPRALPSVQDIVVALPVGVDGAAPSPVTVTFDMGRPDLAGVVAAACDSIFVMAGLPGLTAFEEALGGTGVSLEGLGQVGMLVPVAGLRGEERYRDARRSPNRHRLREAFEQYTRRLPARRAAAEAAVGAAARAAARSRLGASRDEVVREARRYLSVAPGDPVAAAVLGGTAPNRLAGPDVIGLATDLVRIAGARDRLDRVQEAQRRVQEQWERDKRSVVEEDYTRRSVRQGTPLTPEQSAEAARALAAIGDSAAVREARQRTSDERMDLARLVTDLASQRPVLFRLWRTDAPFEARRAVLRSGGGTIVRDRAVLASSAPLRDAVTATPSGRRGRRRPSSAIASTTSPTSSGTSPPSSTRCCRSRTPTTATSPAGRHRSASAPRSLLAT